MRGHRFFGAVVGLNCIYFRRTRDQDSTSEFSEFSSRNLSACSPRMTQHLPPIGLEGAPRPKLQHGDGAGLPAIQVERDLGGVSFLIRVEQNVFDVLIVAKHVSGQCSISVPLTQESVQSLSLEEREALYFDLVAKLRMNSISGEKVKRRLFFAGNPLPSLLLGQTGLGSPRTVAEAYGNGGSLNDEASTSTTSSPCRKLGDLRDHRCSLGSLGELSSCGDPDFPVVGRSPISCAELPPLDLGKTGHRIPFSAPGAKAPLGLSPPQPSNNPVLPLDRCSGGVPVAGVDAAPCDGDGSEG